MGMDPEVDMSGEFDKVLNEIVTRMEQLNVSSIRLRHGAVEVGIGDYPTRQEKEYLASEYDKCFGTAPRSDEQ